MLQYENQEAWLGEAAVEKSRRRGACPLVCALGGASVALHRKRPGLAAGETVDLRKHAPRYNHVVGVGQAESVDENAIGYVLQLSLSFLQKTHSPCLWSDLREKQQASLGDRRWETPCPVPPLLGLRAFRRVEPTCLFKSVHLLGLENLLGSLTDGWEMLPGSGPTKILERTNHRLARKMFLPGNCLR